MLALLVGCGTVEEVDPPAVTRATDVAMVSPDARGQGSTGGMTGAGGSGGGGEMATTGAGGAAGAPGTGGMMTSIGGAAGSPSGAGGAGATYTCADLLACCGSFSTESQAQLKAQCLTVYSSSMTGTTSCGSALAAIKLNGLCP